jgi:hypothetical protein
MSKRKLDDLIDSFESVEISNKPRTKRKINHITVSKLKLTSCENMLKFQSMHKYKNIFGLKQLPNKESFTREEVEILLDQRDRELYKIYMDHIVQENIPEKIVTKVNEII